MIDLILHNVRTGNYGDIIFIEFGNALDEYGAGFGVIIEGEIFVFDYYDSHPDDLRDAANMFEEKGKNCLKAADEKNHGFFIQ